MRSVIYAVQWKLVKVHPASATVALHRTLSRDPGLALHVHCGNRRLDASYALEGGFPRRVSRV